jgi:hypothetical protein
MIKVWIILDYHCTYTHHTKSQIWSMKKNEDAAARRKPKTSAAQIRVQKGVCLLSHPTSNPLVPGTRVLTAVATHRPH